MTAAPDADPPAPAYGLAPTPGGGWVPAQVCDNGPWPAGAQRPPKNGSGARSTRPTTAGCGLAPWTAQDMGSSSLSAPGRAAARPALTASPGNWTTGLSLTAWNWITCAGSTHACGHRTWNWSRTGRTFYAARAHRHGRPAGPTASTGTNSPSETRASLPPEDGNAAHVTGQMNAGGRSLAAGRRGICRD